MVAAYGKGLDAVQQKQSSGFLILKLDVAICRSKGFLTLPPPVTCLTLSLFFLSYNQS
jgi:hypothetical protein